MSTRSSGRSKETITLEKLKELGKTFLPVQPNPELYLHEDMVVVVKTHLAFLQAVAVHTKRLNPCSVAVMGKCLWKMGSREAQLFGDSLSHSYSFCITAGGKATTGQKLAPEVQSVFLASTGVKKEEQSLKRELPSHAGVANSPPKRVLIKCISSPSQIESLYAGSNVQVMQCKEHMYMYVYIIWQATRRLRNTASFI
jgi:hypothetical protein